MSKVKKKDVLEKLAFDIKRYSEQQLLTFVRQGKYHDEVLDFIIKKNNNSLRCISGKDKEMIDEMLALGSDDIVSKLIEHTDNLRRSWISNEAIMSILKKRNISHINSLVDSERDVARMSVALYGNKEHLEYLMSDNLPAVRAIVGAVSAFRGYDEITSILVRDKDSIDSYEARNALSGIGIPKNDENNNPLNTVSDVTEYALKENTKWKKVKSLIPRARSIIISLGFLIIGFVVGGITF